MSARSGLVGKNPLGPIWAHLGPFFAWAGKIEKSMSAYFLVGPGALFTRFGALAAIHPRWGNRLCLLDLRIFTWNPSATLALLRRQNFRFFRIFPAHAKNGPRWPQMEQGGFFSYYSDLANILGRKDFDFEIFLVPRFPDPAWAELGPGLGLVPSGPLG